VVKKLKQKGTVELSISELNRLADANTARNAKSPGNSPSVTMPLSDNTSPRVIDDPFAKTIIDGRYEVLGTLGTGAMGSVFLVKHVRLQKLFALKMIKPELAVKEEFIARFEQEANACSRLEHPNCISVTDFGQTSDGSLYLIMEYADGILLSQLIEEGPVPLDKAIVYIRQVLLGLKHAHGEGIIHRDVKLENIVLCNRDEAEPLIKILDFGMARPSLSDPGDIRITRGGMVMGTPQYMAPEQIQAKDVDARADIYAVGVTLLRLVTGETVFKGDSFLDVFSSKLNAPAPTLQEVSGKVFPEVLEQFVAKALEREPADRFSSAEEMLAALDEVARQIGPNGDQTSPYGFPAGGGGSGVFDRIRQETSGWYRGKEMTPPVSWSKRLVGLITTHLGRVMLVRAASIAVILAVLGTVLARVVSEPESKLVASKLSVPNPEAPPPSEQIPAPGPQDASAEQMTLAGAAPLSDTSSESDEMSTDADAGDTPTEPALTPSEATDDPVLIDAAVLIGRRKCRAAEKKIEASEVADSARAQYLLGKIKICRGQRTTALSFFAKAMALDERYRSDSGILYDVRNMLGSTQLRIPALEFMAKEMDKLSLPLLIRLAGHDLSRQVRHKAQALVEAKGLLDHVDMGAALDLDLNQEKSCKEKRKIVKKLAKLNTKRAKQALLRARDMKTKESFFRTRYRHGCVRGLIIKKLAKMKKNKNADE
jgi:eukaryotic-like serine/threonine-protein kinase